MEKLLSHYIIDRKSGVSYDPFCLFGNHIVAHSNIANRTGETVINIRKLIRGLAERRYRLVIKSLAN